MGSNHFSGLELKITANFGIITDDDCKLDLELLINAVDQLYEIKKSGRIELFTKHVTYLKNIG